MVSGCLSVWGAFALLDYTDDEDLGMFWVRLAVGVVVAAATVWAAWNEHWLATTFLALACCITPVGQGWTWVQLLCIGLAIWTLVKFLAGVMSGRTA